MNEITVTFKGKKITAHSGDLLSDVIGAEKLCGGHGKCGKCKVVAKGALSLPSETELMHLTEEELARGVRLACLTTVLGDCEAAELDRGRAAQIMQRADLPEIELVPAFSAYGVAIDIGTTTLAARLYDRNAVLLSEASALNPQSAHGADVISRIEFALAGGVKTLAELIRDACNALIRELAASAKLDAALIDGAVITGNTAMLYLLFEEEVTPLSRAPFDVKRLFGESVTAAELGLSSLEDETQVYIPSSISAFVGADTLCAIAATGLLELDGAMLADIGTNGEMALFYNGALTVCSTAAGPAFEGVGISRGMRGAVGAIDKVTLVNSKPVSHVIGETEAVGVCGSGLVDAAACMLDLEVLEDSGYLDDESFALTPSVAITRQDVRMLQLAKSAICAGLLALLKNKNIEPSAISTLYIAGGFGTYLGKESAAKIGLLPRRLANVSKAVGNAALAGASMLLLNSDLREKTQAVAKRAAVLDLSTDSAFSELFMTGMLLDEV